MAHYLAYWRSFWDEDLNTRHSYIGWGTSSPSKFARNDVLWIIVRASDPRFVTTNRYEWRLARCLYVSCNCVVRESRYGKYMYRVVAELPDSIVFSNLEMQGNLSPELKKLQFEPAKSIPYTVNDSFMGKYFQRTRKLCESDIQILQKYSDLLPRFAGEIYTHNCSSTT